VSKVIRTCEQSIRRDWSAEVDATDVDSDQRYIAEGLRFDNKPHRESENMPTASHESLEEGGLRRLLVDVHGLRVERCGEVNDLMRC
jgi:hypothetical protein